MNLTKTRTVSVGVGADVTPPSVLARRCAEPRHARRARRR
jgi:hypothetical protein